MKEPEDQQADPSLDTSSLAAGIIVTLAAFLRDYIMKPLGFIILTVMAVAAVIAVTGGLIAFITHQMGQDQERVIRFGIFGGIYATIALMIIAVPIAAGLHAKWRKTGRKYALARQERKNAQRKPDWS